jgi:hypothetical protein
MFKDYQLGCKDGRVRPGRMHVWKSLAGDWIVNFPTKRDWRDPSRYEDIDAGLDDLRDYLENVGAVTVALPALGCGHGGLEWERVSTMIREKLDGLDAHVLVFAPSASRQAGRSATEVPTEDERAGAEKLGYQLVEPGNMPALQLSNPAYLLGKEALLARKWIALMPSRAPGEREMRALRAIAVELARSESMATVALVHGARVSEDVAQIFADEGIDTVLLLPFGVLTRKAIAKQRMMNVTLLSAAPAKAKWSRQLFAQAQDVLRANAAAVLLSDPEPDWLTSKGLSKWAQTPISYIRYETTPLHMREALTGVGARPIGRRGEDGAPNIDYVVSAFNATRVGQPAETDVQGTDAELRIAGQPSAPIQEEARNTAKVVTIAWNSVPDNLRRNLLDFLCELNAANVTVSFEMPFALTEADRKRLKALSLNEDKE